MKQLKKENFKRCFIEKTWVLLISSTLFLVNTNAGASTDPDNLQLKIDSKYRYLFPDTDVNSLEKEGVFDLTDEVSSFVSIGSKPLLGNYPGIRTVAVVDNLTGSLETCSRLSVNYQIVDIDGDWDATKTVDNALSEDGLSPYTHHKTSDTILWGFIPKGGSEQEIIWVTATEHPEVSISKNNVTLEIPAEININGEMVSTVGMKVVYKIMPWTMLGSFPYTLKDDIPVLVNDLSKGKFLEPSSETGNLAISYEPNWFMEDIVRGEFTFPGLDKRLFETKSFIKPTGIEIIEGNINNCSTNNDIITVKIYPNNNPGENVLANLSDPNKSIAENLENKPKLFTSRTYQSEVEIKTLEGKSRRLTLDEYTNSPFTWHLYYPINESCLQGTWNNPLHQSNLSASCLNVHDIPTNQQENSDRFGYETVEENGIVYIKHAWLKLQNSNNDALASTVLEGSEQGAFMTVSFSLTEQSTSDAKLDVK